MQFRLTINIAGAALIDEGEDGAEIINDEELATIIAETGDAVASGRTNGPVTDGYGNTIGSFEIVDN